MAVELSDEERRFLISVLKQVSLQGSLSEMKRLIPQIEGLIVKLTAKEVEGGVAGADTPA